MNPVLEQLYKVVDKFIFNIKPGDRVYWPIPENCYRYVDELSFYYQEDIPADIILMFRYRTKKWFLDMYRFPSK